MGSRGALVESLTKLLGSERVLTSRCDIIPYCSDYFHRDSYKEFGAWPICVVLPETTEEVSDIVKLAIEHKVAIVPRGGGSSQVGGVMPIENSIVLSTARMNKVIDIDSVNLMVTAQPGVNLKAIDDILEPYGFVLAQEQGSYKTANIGGAVSTNGFSLRHNKYRDIGDNVVCLEVVLGDGRILKTGRKVCSNSSGYPLHKLFVGAEGTLGIITELTLRIHPKPEKEIALLALFKDWETVEETHGKIMSSGINFTGGYATQTKFEDLSEESVNAILIGLEGTALEVEASRKLMVRLLEECGGKIQEPELTWEVWRSQRTMWCGTASDEFEIDDLVAAMPIQYYDEAHDRIVKEVYPKYGVQMNPEGHRVILLGSRPIVTFNFVFDASKLSFPQMKKMFGEMMTIIAEYGGAGPGCHAMGEVLSDHFAIEHDPVRFEVMRSIKKSFDPHNILNPGKKFKMS